MPGPAVRCPSCGHALFTVDEPAWPVCVHGIGPEARGEPAPGSAVAYRVTCYQ